MKVKTLPKNYDFESLFTQFDGYDYFESGNQGDLYPQIEAFSIAHAWLLAECSMLVYASPSVISKAITRCGALEHEIMDVGALRFLYLRFTGFQIVVFRGTVSHYWENLLTDLQFLPGAFGRQGLVHCGFHIAIKKLWKILLKILHRQKIPLPIFFTGHSLGAALATLACHQYRHEPKVLYTFGSPRVGDARFAKRFSCPAYRIVNNNDVIAHLPPSGIYRHFGEPIFIDHTGRLLVDGGGYWNRFKSKFFGNVNYSRILWGQWQAGHFNQIPFDWLINHSPYFYSIHCWNAYVKKFTKLRTFDG